MELSNEFTVDVPVDRAWEVLTDVPTIAPCLPGAQLQEVEGDEYRGIVKVKVGPITAQYKGKATFVETDGTAHRVVLRAEGRETRGQGNASALITAEMHPEGHRTKVTVSTDLTVTGKVAQFGRGVMADVSAKLMDQFAENLRTTVLADVPAGGVAPDVAVAPDVDADAPAVEEAPAVAPAVTEAPSDAAASTNGSSSTNGSQAAADDRPRVRTFDLPEPEPVDLLDAAGTPVLRRALPALGLLLVFGIVVAVLLRRRRG
jgi:carbon monoxide dehydrogenase subunit G